MAAALRKDEVIRQKLLREEQALSKELLSLYRHAEGRIKGRLAKLEQQLRTVENETWEVKDFQRRRIEALLDQIRGELNAIAPKAAKATEKAKAARVAQVVTDGKIMAKALQIAGTWAALPTHALEELAKRSMQGTPLHALFEQINHDAVEKMRQSLFGGIAEGKNPRLIGKEISTLVEEVTRYRGVLIARTETLRAYRESSIQQMQRNAHVLQGWRWTAGVGSSRVCPFCLAMDGRIFPLTEQLGSHPCCRCVATPVLITGDIARETGAEWFDKQDEKTQLEILGPSKLYLYQNGQITLADLADRHPTEWGPSGNVRSVKGLVDEGIIDHKQALKALTAGRAA